MTDNSAAFGNVAPMGENMDWNEELGQGTDGLEYDYTGALVEEARDNDLEVQAMHSYLDERSGAEEQRRRAALRRRAAR